jgi:LysM repeat protein
VEFHTVRSGENLTTISRKYGLSVSDLLRLNNLGKHTTLHKGQKLRVKEEAFPKSAAIRKKQSLVMAQFKSKSGRALASAKSSRGAKAISVAAESSRPMRRHIVRRGETLFDVSKKYGVALNRLARANGLRVNYRVMAGQRLLIPD